MDSVTRSNRMIAGGVDTHSEVHVAAAVCATSHQLLGTAAFPTTAVGYEQLIDWLESFGHVDRVGVEGTGSYGAALARMLADSGVAVVEVDRPDRAARRRHGKSDPLDAEAAARAVLTGRATATPKARDGRCEAIRALKIVHRSALRDRTAAINQFHALMITASPSIRAELEALSRHRQVQRARRWRDRDGEDVVDRATRRALSELARRVHVLSQQAERLNGELDDLTAQAAPALRDLIGAGVHVAADLLIAAGDNPDRLASEAAFAHLCGAAPIPASSGKTHRHRLNRAGDRHANQALWRIVMVRRTHDERTRRYFQRRKAEGLSDRDITRCLKRYVAREVHRALTRPLQAPPQGAELRRLRLAAGLTLNDVAARVGIPNQRVSRIERAITRDPALRRKLHDLVTNHQALTAA